VGHFHLTMASAAFLGTFGAIYYWMPKLFGTMGNQKLAKIHFWVSFIGLNGVFIGQLISGYAGQPRRLYDPYQYAFTQQLLEVNQITSYFAFALFAGQIVFVINWFQCVFGKKEECPDNPWDVGTLEWTISSPPPTHNFTVIPTVYRGPYEFSNPEVKKALGRDWLGQAEIWPPQPETPSAAEPAQDAGEGEEIAEAGK
jgi:cytochrome c oxidase subunit 1